MSLRLKRPIFRAPLAALIVAPFPVVIYVIVPAVLLAFYGGSDGVLPDGLKNGVLDWVLVSLGRLGVVYPLGVLLAWPLLLHWIWISRNKVFKTSREITVAVYWRLAIVTFVVPAVIFSWIASMKVHGYTLPFAGFFLSGAILGFISTIPAYRIFRNFAFERV